MDLEVDGTCSYKVILSAFNLITSLLSCPFTTLGAEAS